MANTSNSGRTLKLFLVDGSPNGLLTAEIMNWTGHLITGPRSSLAQLIQRPEAKRTGVYFLVGPDSGAGLGAQVYIGETDDIAQRITAHNRPEDKGGKDFWERVCVVTSKDANLTKGHVKYLESLMISIAHQAQKCEQLNKTNPGYTNLPEADKADMEFFLVQIQTLLPVLGFDFLRETPALALPLLGGNDGIDMSTATPAQLTSPVFLGSVKRHETVARGQEIDGEFIVLKGSTARLNWEGSTSNYEALFNNLVKSGVLVPTQGGKLNIFTRNCAFSSPSAAAAIVTGRNANGRVHWKIEGSGQSYAEWQEARIAMATMDDFSPKLGLP